MRTAQILIVDDEPQICRNIKEICEYEGYEADFVTTAKEAFQRVAQNEYKLLLVDIRMEKSGVEVIKLFRAKANRPKIVVISAIPRDELDPMFEKEKIVTTVDGYLDKPGCCNPEELRPFLTQFV